MTNADLFVFLCLVASAILIHCNYRVGSLLPKGSYLDFKVALPKGERKMKKNVIAYAIVITKCIDLESSVLPGAAVLADLIHQNSARGNESRSKYDYELYAIIYENEVSTTCEVLLQRIGYKTLRKPIPVEMKSINHSRFLHDVERNGCCGASEFLKLWIYTLMDHPAVVYLDLDVLILKPLDDMLDVLILPPDRRKEQYQRVKIVADRGASENQTISALITRDYSQVQMQNHFEHYRKIPVQGGFFAARPDVDTFHRLCQIIGTVGLSYTASGSWGGAMWAGYWGMPQIQGLLAYYYSFIEQESALELHYCYYNTIMGVTRYKDKCMDGSEDCEDCRETPPDHIVMAHPIFCFKPWQCINWHNPKLMRTKPCQRLMTLWATTRLKLEEKWSKKLTWEMSRRDGNLLPEVYQGYCFENHTFIPMRFHYDSLLPK
jgi:hypothetical protein